MSGSITRIRGSNMTDLDLIGMKGKKYQDKVEQSCPSCKLDVLALRINGFYAGSRERIFLWECPSCGSIWRKARPKLKSEQSLRVGGY